MVKKSTMHRTFLCYIGYSKFLSRKTVKERRDVEKDVMSRWRDLIKKKTFMDCRGFSGSQSFFFRIRSVVKRQSKSLAKPPSPSGQASDGIYRILSKGTGLTAMPRPSSGKPLKVFLSVMIESITDISEVNMDMTLTICIHQAWHDHR